MKNSVQSPTGEDKEERGSGRQGIRGKRGGDELSGRWERGREERAGVRWH